MTPAEFDAACTSLRWTPSSVARWCGYKRQTVERWRNGTAQVPPAVAAWLHARLAGGLDDPPIR